MSHPSSNSYQNQFGIFWLILLIKQTYSLTDMGENITFLAQVGEWNSPMPPHPEVGLFHQWFSLSSTKCCSCQSSWFSGGSSEQTPAWWSEQRPPRTQTPQQWPERRHGPQLQHIRTHPPVYIQVTRKCGWQKISPPAAQPHSSGRGTDWWRLLKAVAAGTGHIGR